jgi:hypothetical protein
LAAKYCVIAGVAMAAVAGSGGTPGDAAAVSGKGRERLMSMGGGRLHERPAAGHGRRDRLNDRLIRYR